MQATGTGSRGHTAPDAMRTAYALRALGRRGFPPTVSVGGKSYRLTVDVKHDFFAATGFYDADDQERVVVKFGRDNDFLGIPLRWLGRFLRDRELRMYATLRDLPNLPRVLGTVGKSGFILQFLHGRPLRKDSQVPDGFFDKLRTLVQKVHERGIAYVDMNKKANIIIGNDNEPYLVDFQISWDLHEMGDNFINRRILKRLQQEDLYHVNKHHARLRPDELTPEQREASVRRSVLIRVHRSVTRLYFKLRRRTWKRLRETGRILPEGSE